jgi:hypothetical protein
MVERQREIAEGLRGRMTIDVEKKLKRMFRSAIMQEGTTAVKVIDGIMRQYVMEEMGEDALKEIDAPGPQRRA